MPGELSDTPLSEENLRFGRAMAIQMWSEAYEKLRPAEAYEASLMDEAHDLAEFGVAADTRTLAILVVSFIEDALKRAFVEHWNISGPKQLDRYFGNNGPLATFSQRSLAAQGLAWLGPEGARELDSLRKIRNSFAHNHKVHSLTDPQVSKLAAALPKREQVWCHRYGYAAAYESAGIETKLRLRLYCAGMVITGATIGQAKVVRAQIPPGFKPGRGWDAMQEVERGLLDASIRFCWRSLGLGYSGATYQYREEGPRPWESFKSAGRRR